MDQEKKQIKEIEISNFKSFKSLKISNIAHFNLFIGMNNIGKTSVLEAIAMLFGFFPKQFLRSYLREVRAENLEEIQDFLMFFHNYDPANPIKLVSSFQNDNKIRLGLKHQKELDSEKINCEVAIDKQNYKPISWDVSKKANNHSSNPKATDEVTQALEKALAKHQSSFTSSFKGKFTDYETFNYKFCPTIRFIHQDFLLTTEEADLVRAKSSKQDILQFVQKIDPRIEDVIVDDNLALLYLQNIDKPAPINHLGTGFFKVLKLYLAILVNGIDAILFDEITDGLHPDTIQILLDEIIPRLVKQNIQLFATTHSYDILQKIAEYQKEDKENISVYFLYQTEKDCIVKAHHYPQKVVLQLKDFADLRRGEI